MAANAHVVQLKQSLQFFSRTCSVFKEDDSNFAPTPGPRYPHPHTRLSPCGTRTHPRV